MVPCALGRSGLTLFKAEGDGATPRGVWPLRYVFYRPDRLARPRTGLACIPLQPNDGWCDAAGDRLYNRPVPLPYPASAEHLWREDSLYDVIVVLGHNDDPPVPGRGSAIFLHVASPDHRPTEGCVALRLDHLVTLLQTCGPQTVMYIG